jgi:hypothetical protein
MNIWLIIFAFASITIPYLIVRHLADGTGWCLRSFNDEKWGCISTVGFLGIVLVGPYVLREVFGCERGASGVIAYSLSVIFFWSTVVDWKRLRQKNKK